MEKPALNLPLRLMGD